MKHRHNKKRNTAFLYEILILEFAKAAFNKKEDLRQNILGCIRESFRKDSLLYKELKLYKELVDSSSLDELTAEKILIEVKRQREKIDDDKLCKEQSALARKIKKMLSGTTFTNFVPNFKSLASIAQIFNKTLPIKSKVLLENEIVKHMTRKGESEKMAPVTNLVFQSFVKRYNDEYSGLYEEQKVLLNKFIHSFADNGLDLKVHVSNEIKRLKQALNESMNDKDIQSDAQLMGAAKEVIEMLEHYKSIQIGKEIIQEILKIQNLIREITKDVIKD